MADSSSESKFADRRIERITSVLNPRASEFVPFFIASKPKSAADDASAHRVHAQLPPARGGTSRRTAAKRSGTKAGRNLKAREGVRSSDELQAGYARSRRAHQRAVEGLGDFAQVPRSPSPPLPLAPPLPPTTTIATIATTAAAVRRRNGRHDAQGARRGCGGSRCAKARRNRRSNFATAQGDGASATSDSRGDAAAEGAKRRDWHATRAADEITSHDAPRRTGKTTQRRQREKHRDKSCPPRDTRADDASTSDETFGHGKGGLSGSVDGRGSAARPTSSPRRHTVSDYSAPATRGRDGREHKPLEGEIMSRTFVPSTEQADDEEFPTLSITAKDDRDQAPCIPSSSPQKSLPQKAQGLDYSSLKERLALEADAAATAAAAVSSEGRETKSSGYQLRLDVLPGFGKSRDERSGLQDYCGRSAGEPNELVGSGEGNDGRDFATIQQPMPARGITSAESFPQDSPVPPPSAPSAPTGTIVTLKERRAGSATLSIPLRERLRQRWFRLEASKRAERQREMTERELMAVEDGNAVVEGHVGWGTGGHGVGSNWVRRLQSGGRQGAKQSNGDEASSSSGSGGDAKDRSSDCDDPADSDSEGGLPVAATTGLSHDNGGELVNAKAGSRRHKMVFAGSPLVPAHESIGSRITSMPMSASGAAAIRRSQAEAESRSQGEKASVALTTGPPSDCAFAAPGITRETDNKPQALSSEEQIEARQGDHCNRPVQGDDSAAAQAGRLTRVITVEEDDGGSQAGFTKRIHAVCEAGLDGELNELLVRSIGRAADERDELRRTPLHLAAEAGSLECVVLLLKSGMRLDQRDRWRETPLHKAARGGFSQVVKALCAARMKVNSRNRFCENPLLLAVRADSHESVAVLLSFGARLNDPDYNGVTPVCEAAMSGQSQILMSMVNSNQACRKVGSQDSTDPFSMRSAVSARHSCDPVTPRWSSAASRASSGLAVVRIKGRHSRYRIPRDCETGEERENGLLNPNPALSPMHEAAGAGQVETLSLLIDVGVSIEEWDIRRSCGKRGQPSPAGDMVGDTPLGRAVRAGKLDCATTLLDAGAMVDRENAQGETPLTVAICTGQPSAVELLVERGAALDSAGLSGRPFMKDGSPTAAERANLTTRRIEPLERAIRSGQLACAAVLIERGAPLSHMVWRSMGHGRHVPVRRRSAAQRDASEIKSTLAEGLPETADPTILPSQTEILGCMSPEIREVAESVAPLNSGGGGVLEDSDYIRASLSRWASNWRECSCRGGVVRERSGTWSEGSGESDNCEHLETERDEKMACAVGFLPGVGECDVVVVLADGSRLPVHACLLAAFSGAFRDLFLPVNGRDGSERRSPTSSSNQPTRDNEEHCIILSVDEHSAAALGDRPTTSVRPADVARPCGGDSAGSGGKISSADRVRIVGSCMASMESKVQSIGPTISSLRKEAGKILSTNESACSPREAAAAASVASGGVTAERDVEELHSRTNAIYAVLVEESPGSCRQAEDDARPGASQRSRHTTLKTPVVDNPEPQPPREIDAASFAAASAAAYAAMASTNHHAGIRKPPRKLTTIGWGVETAEVFVRFWGAGTMAAIIKHCYFGRPPTGFEHPKALLQLLVAATSLRMSRLMRQVEHLLFATLTQQPNNKRLTNPRRTATMLRAARALGAADLESRCALLLQANGFVPEVMKLRLELGVPSLNASDVDRGFDRLNGRGYLGSGPAHAWLSSVVPNPAVEDGGAAVAGSKTVAAAATLHALDLLFRTRALDFDDLVPALVHRGRRVLVLPLKRSERIHLLKAAMGEGCTGKMKMPATDPSSKWNDVKICQRCCDDGGLGAVPAASNFVAFSHGMGWLLRTGALADVVLILAQSTEEAEGVERREGHASPEMQRKKRNDDARPRVVVPAHSWVLAARSEKFAAMLRFVRRQDAQASPLTPPAYDGGTKGENGGDPGRDRWCDGEADGGDNDDDVCPNGAFKTVVVPTSQSERESVSSETASARQHEPQYNQGCEAHADTTSSTEIPDGVDFRRGCCEERRRETGLGVDGPRRRRMKRLERDGVKSRVPRLLELHSPLLSPRLLGLFLEFCYTGVLDPGLSALELSELALVADEYLVPELTRQVEMLLREIFRDPERRAKGDEIFPGASEEAAALELFQLAGALGLKQLARSTAWIVLQNLAVFSSEALSGCGMTRRELVLTALEAARP